MSPQVDRSRGAVYQAEESVARVMRSRHRTVRVDGAILRLPQEVQFGTLATVQAYVDRVVAEASGSGTLPDRGPVVVAKRRGFGRATYAGGTISIPAADPRGRWALTRGVVLHEVGHHLAGEQGHGPAFRSTVVELYRRHVSPDAAHLLGQLFAPIDQLPDPISGNADDSYTRRVAGLLAKAEGAASVDEAEAYLAKASLVAQRHSVDLALAALSERGRVEKPTHRMLTIGDPRRHLNPMLTNLLITIGQSWDLRADIGPGSTYVILYGLPGDLNQVESLFGTAATVMVQRARQHVQAGAWRGTSYLKAGAHDPRPVTAAVARNAFILGFIARLAGHLGSASRQAHDVAAHAVPGAGVAAAGAGVDVALRAREVAIADYYASTTRARGTWRGSASHAASATLSHRAGERAADDFQRPQIADRRRAIGR